MTEPAAVENVVPVPGEPASDTSWMPRAPSLAEQFSDNLSNIASGIILAGASYPVVLAICYSIFGIVMVLTSQATAKEVLQSLIVTLAFGIFGAGIELVCAATVAVFMLPLVYLVVRSLEMRGSIIRLGAFCGGLVGFVSAFPFIIAAPNMAWSSEMAIAVGVGPMLATIVGQVGRAWGGWQVGRYERAVARATKDIRIALGSGTDGSELASDTDRRRVRFGIRHLLIASIWISILLTAIRLSGLGFSFVLILLAVWGLFQAATLRLGGLLIRVWGWFRQRRQSCST